MPVVGAVVTVSDDLDLSFLAADPRYTIGPAQGHRVPVVVTSQSHHEDRALLENLLATPGVVDVEVAFADFSDGSWVSP